MAVLAPMRSALGFLTVLGGSRPPEPRAAAWFAPVGALVGLAVGAVWWAAGELWPPLLAAILAVAADAGLTGMIHLDGLADTADGVLPPLERDRRLAVMSAPDIGAFGVTTLVITVVLRVAALTATAPDVLLVAGLWAASRAAMAVTLATRPYARAGGLATAFTVSEVGAACDVTATGAGGAGDGRGLRTVAPGAVGLAGGAVLALAGGGWAAGGAAAVGLLAGFAGVVALAHRRLGGFTGDILGAAGVVGETVGLVLAAARW